MCNKFIFNSLMLVALTFISACVSNANEDSQGEAPIDPQLLELTTQKKLVYNQMASVIAAATCEVDSQCASMPVGNTDCGGPADYLVYSSMIGEEAVNKLKKMADLTKQFDTGIAQFKQSAGTGTYGICKYNTPSDLSCVDNVCKEVASEVIR